MMAPRRYGWLLASALSCAGLAAACAEGDDLDGDGGEAADAAAEEGEAKGASFVDLADDELANEPPVLAIARLGAILLALDDGEVGQAEVELERGRDAVVLDFAAQMRDEHSLHADDLEALLFDRGIPPVENTLSGALRLEAFAGMSELGDTPRGRIDFAYMRTQVVMHTAAGVLVERLIDLAPEDEELLDFLLATRDAIAGHRLEAVAILRVR
jgi:predicted outer membrane protein